MAQKNKIKTNPIPRMIKDHNLTERYQRGEIAIEVGADPDNPKRSVTRMRRKCAYDEMWKRGTITEEQRLAAEHYAILCEKALGAKGDLYATINLLTVNRSKWEPTPTQHEAFKELFYIWKELGKFHTNILNKIVLDNKNSPDLAIEIGWSRNYTKGLILSVFVRLEEITEKIT